MRRLVYSYVPGTSPAGPLSSELTGTGLVADDLYLMAVREGNGRPYLKARAFGLGLAGGLLAELIVTWRALGIGQDEVAVLPWVSGPRYRMPGDPVAREVLRLILAEPRRWRVRDLLRVIGQDAPRMVAGRLEARGLSCPAFSGQGICG
jgi:hypothetical protein